MFVIVGPLGIVCIIWCLGVFQILSSQFIASCRAQMVQWHLLKFMLGRSREVLPPGHMYVNTANFVWVDPAYLLLYWRCLNVVASHQWLLQCSATSGTSYNLSWPMQIDELGRGSCCSAKDKTRTNPWNEQSAGMGWRFLESLKSISKVLRFHISHVLEPIQNSLRSDVRQHVAHVHRLISDTRCCRSVSTLILP